MNPNEEQTRDVCKRMWDDEWRTLSVRRNPLKSISISCDDYINSLWINRVTEYLLCLIYNSLYEREETKIQQWKDELKRWAMYAALSVLKSISSDKQYEGKKAAIREISNTFNYHDYDFIYEQWQKFIKNNENYDYNIFNEYKAIIHTLFEFICQSDVNKVKKYIDNEL
jgi:hypothetical protein